MHETANPPSSPHLSTDSTTRCRPSVSLPKKLCSAGSSSLRPSLCCACQRNGMGFSG